MKVSVLGSGSNGNAVLVQSGRARILVDAGFSARELERRLSRIGVEAAEVSAIVITHDHGDHTRGSGVFARRHRTPVYVTEATRRACARLFRGNETLLEYRPGRPFGIDDVRVEPFMTVHDAADPVALALVNVESGVPRGPRDRSGSANRAGAPRPRRVRLPDPSKPTTTRPSCIRADIRRR